MKTALITGITGQDGSYLTELLLEKGYEVHGVVRRCSSISTGRIDHLFVDKHEPGARLFLHYGDMLDPMGLERIVAEVAPDEIYNLAAQSHVGTSFAMPEYTTGTIVNGTLALLEICRRHKSVRMYQASSSEMFGNSMDEDGRQRETTPMRPVSPYGAAKLNAHNLCRQYREMYDVFVCCGILFNHESPRRDERMVTRKITRAMTRIKLGLQDVVYLGNLDAARDWGFAGDYVCSMWHMMQLNSPDDFVVGSGVNYRVRDLIEMVGQKLDMDAMAHVRIDERYMRPIELHALLSDSMKIVRRFGGWKRGDREAGLDLDQLLDLMVGADLELAERELAIKDLTRPETSGTLVATIE